MHCDRCEMVSINGVPCHETGCPNTKKTWVDGEWVKMFECIECGNEYEDIDDAYKCCGMDNLNEQETPNDED